MFFWLKRRRKFFQEIEWKYDVRYYRGTQPPDAAIACLIEALGVFMRVCAEAGVQPFLAHGTLIGWWWSRALLPWDDDIDVLLTHRELVALLRFNKRMFDKRYRLEINPHHNMRATLNRWPGDQREQNKIDARFFDTHNGLYIDITALHPVDDVLMATKCPHVFPREWMFPLQRSTLSGIDVFVPSRPSDMLMQEYGPEVLTATRFNGYHFDSTSTTWLRDQPADS